jgi:hypothetical protein
MAMIAADAQGCSMAARTWHTIRIEIAKAPGFPAGSATRAFMLRLPLDAEGRFDQEAWARQPSLATFRRFWPSERDVRGTIRLDDTRLSLINGDKGGEPCCHIEIDEVVRIGATARFCAADGASLPFRVTTIEHTQA